MYECCILQDLSCCGSFVHLGLMMAKSESVANSVAIAVHSNCIKSFPPKHGNQLLRNIG